MARVTAFQAVGRGFESRLPLQIRARAEAWGVSLRYRLTSAGNSEECGRAVRIISCLAQNSLDTPDLPPIYSGLPVECVGRFLALDNKIEEFLKPR